MKIAGPDNLAAFLSERHRDGRRRRLSIMRKAQEFLPISLAEDLLQLSLSPDEQQLILQTTGGHDNLALEHFLTQRLLGWHQDLACTALHQWCRLSEHRLWFRLVQLVKSPHVSQRVRYTVLDLCWYAGGKTLLDVISEQEGVRDLSPAFHGLLLQRASQWLTGNDQLTKLAKTITCQFHDHPHPENKALPSAIGYLAGVEPDELLQLQGQPISENWRDLLRAVTGSHQGRTQRLNKLKKFVTSPTKKDRLHELWPALWERSHLDPATVWGAIKLSLTDTAPKVDLSSRPASCPWEFFGGIPAPVLTEALTHAETVDELVRGTMQLGWLLGFHDNKELQALLQDWAKRDGEAKAWKKLPAPARDLIGNDIAGNIPGRELDRQTYAALKAEEQALKEGRLSPLTPFAERLADTAAVDSAQRKQFLALAGGASDTPPLADADPLLPNGTAKKGDEYWTALIGAWQNPEQADLAKLAELARKENGVFRLCYIKTLGRFTGIDEAALKTLDFIRSLDSDEITTVIRALCGIGTPRAHQELVASLTRPNISHSLRIEICSHLQTQDLSNLQKELRAALNDIEQARLPSDGPGWDLQEAVSNLLVAREVEPAAAGGVQIINDASLDKTLEGKIPHYRTLSSEVKRALRTALFFHQQVSGDDAPDSIDLSPVIDMQYKSLELFFRENFEEPCSRLIHRGVLQRRLDVIGYARPIPQAMEQFENYLSSLPTIREIPFFSKFKLRKMLRAICQFRPGRRFTLDGLKAFALFFLCFSRQQCRHGLQGLFRLGFQDDDELFSFVKMLHVLQDARNRAAHEGFHPDASNDIDGIWIMTAEIIQTAVSVRARLEEGTDVSEYAPKNTSEPVIQRRKRAS